MDNWDDRYGAPRGHRAARRVSRAISERDRGRRRLNTATATVGFASVLAAGAVAAVLPGSTHKTVSSTSSTSSTSSVSSGSSLAGTGSGTWVPASIPSPSPAGGSSHSASAHPRTSTAGGSSAGGSSAPSPGAASSSASSPAAGSSSTPSPASSSTFTPPTAAPTQSSGGGQSTSGGTS